MKRAFILFWHGLTGILAGMANWFTAILGMRDDSRYGRFLRRFVGSCFAFLMLLLVVAASLDFFRIACYRMSLDRYLGNRDYDVQYVSRSVEYHTRYDEKGYLMTSDGEKTIRGIRWIAKPLGADSLVCYHDGKKRGYFNKFTGKPVIEPKYNHAWIFSDGLAAVEDDGRIKFIDATGKVVIDPKISYIRGMDGYVFHNGLCVIHNSRQDRLGLIDKQGKWVLQPEYLSIYPSGKFWIVDNGEGVSVLDSTQNTIIPFTEGQVRIHDEYISVTLGDHIMRRYNHGGELIDDFLVNDVSYMTYESDELRYTTTKSYEEGTLISETEDAEPLPVEKMAKCRRYEAECGWYGLMTADGKVITPPSYSEIKAIGYDTYLCKDNAEDGVILNGRGERIR